MQIHTIITPFWLTRFVHFKLIFLASLLIVYSSRCQVISLPVRSCQIVNFCLYTMRPCLLPGCSTLISVLLTWDSSVKTVIYTDGTLFYNYLGGLWVVMFSFTLHFSTGVTPTFDLSALKASYFKLWSLLCYSQDSINHLVKKSLNFQLDFTANEMISIG